MNLRLVLPIATGMLTTGCFDPDPVPLESTTGTGNPESTTTAADPSASDEDGCEDGCTTTVDPTDCSEDCAALSDDCNDGVCEAGSCVLVPRADGLACDDGSFCTEGDTCTAGVCGGTALQCPGAGGCSIGVCDDEADECTVEAVGEGDPCDDTDPCTDDGVCTAGECEPGPQVCDALGDDCNAGVCNPGVGCETMPANTGFPCDIGNNCAQSSCSAGSCIMNTPINEGLDCEDGDFCSFGDVCQAGSCVAGTAAACPEDDVCGTWACDEGMDECVLTPLNEGMGCDDGNLCTPPAASQCVAGACIMPTGGGANYTYLWEDFADNSAGWALGPEWEIGPAMVSVGGTPGADPGFDHTFTADEGVAGVVIGGQAAQVLHPYYYLTSPPMDVPAGEAAILGFRRWLNSDYDPFMHNSIEVFDGVGWVQIWVSGPSPAINDTEWLYIQHDLTAYANDAMRVRFGFDITQDGVFSAPSWNIDDVLVSSIVCP
ncbi:MAG: hypothetical protein AB1Z98_11050 [Nannocystaceae bacterium]